MIETHAVIIVIVMMAAIVYATRAGGYLLGLQLRRIAFIQPVLEALPGCAFMAVLVPAVRQGNLIEIVSLSCVLVIMWKTDNVALATLCGLLILLLSPTLLTNWP